jgi:hypothetical protein
MNMYVMFESFAIVRQLKMCGRVVTKKCLNKILDKKIQKF